MGARLDPVRYLDKPGHPSLHRVYTFSLRYQRRSILSCDQTIDILQKTEVQEAGVYYDIICLDCCRRNHLSTYAWMVSFIIIVSIELLLKRRKHNYNYTILDKKLEWYIMYIYCIYRMVYNGIRYRWQVCIGW